MEEQKRVHKAKEDSRLEDELLDMCIKQSLEEKERLLADTDTTEQIEPDEESTNEEKSAEKSEKKTLASLVARSHPPALPPKLMARFVRDVTMPDGSEVAPCSTFFKTWRVRNDGKGDWPENCHLVSAGGDRLLDSKLGDDFVLRHPVPATAAGEEVEVTLELCAPDATGRHVGYFRLESPDGGYFGQRLWADIRVTDADMSVSMTLSPWEVIDTSADEKEEKEEQTDVTSSDVVDSSSEEVHQETVLTNDDERDRLLEETPLVQEPVPQQTSLTPEQVQQQEFDAEVALWAKELRVLSAMGFHDLEQLLPVLKAHIQVPAAKQEESGSTEQPGSEAGLQAVVLALLSGQE
jgi:next-to-BRCA1 protein 1